MFPVHILHDERISRVHQPSALGEEGGHGGSPRKARETVIPPLGCGSFPSGSEGDQAG